MAGRTCKVRTGSVQLHDKLVAVLEIFQKLKNVYPQATLHDCIDGNDDNRVSLGYTVITSDEKLDEQIKKKNKK